MRPPQPPTRRAPASRAVEALTDRVKELAMIQKHIHQLDMRDLREALARLTERVAALEARGLDLRADHISQEMCRAQEAP